MHASRTVRRVIVAIVAATSTLAVAVPAAVPAHAAGSDRGLYGAADPTYDGVFRQSLGIMGLAANRIAPPPAAIAWLLGQQCADGSFQAYRADTSVPCAKPDPVNFTGPDTNQTALALMALMAIDDSTVPVPQATVNRAVTASEKAARWLRRAQSADGGWPYYPGGASDANSTGLALSAILTQAPSYDFPAYKRAARFLGTVSATCANGGGFAYQAGSKVDGSATAQGLIGLVGPMPVSPRPVAIAAPCANTAKAKAVSYLATALTPSGVLPSALGSGPDYSSTATAVLGLVAAGQGRRAVAKATAALASNARGYVTGTDGTVPGAAGLLLMVAEATGGKPTAFGGVNLVSTLNASMRK